ncbi:TonB-dependent siderophore receptor [Novosphingobium sp. FKTRR1]|uniref:TonB-dependent receptor plug domain-containing protein n=1 Tax=Novosphingobium sp. FKTRR1 TaxID=2879118 RepID=UPI001CF02441|nr:TonB-dependent receptor [Novosphingobium sp. FKTRR1]
MTEFRPQGRRALRLAMSASVLALTFPMTAWAQDVAPSPAAPDAAKAPARDDVIVVTGTRIRRPDYATASPTVSFGTTQLVQAGTTNVTDFLTSMPALIGSSTSRDNSGDRAGIGATGLNLLNLRNLGTDRTLVLVDGRRHVSGLDGSQSVDINTIPEDLIERVDILTGGASAIYGADAVSGVVNFIMKKKFSGITMRGQSGISKYGDAGNQLIAVTAGHNFDRGNITLSYEYNQEDRLESHQRPEYSGTASVGFFRNPDYDKTKPGSYSRIPQSDVRYEWTSRVGAVDVTGDGVPDFTGTGKVYNLGTEIPGGYSKGSDDTLVSDYANDLRPSIKRHIVNMFSTFNLSDSIEVYSELKYANIKAYSLAQPTFDYYMFVPGDNPFIPTAIQNAISPDMGGVLVTRDNFDLGQRGESIKRETVRGVLGARGDLSSNLHYDVSWVFGQTDVTNNFINDRYTDRWNAAIDAVTDPATGRPTCRVNLDPTAAAHTTFKPGECVPFNLFGEGVSSQAALNFIRANTTEHSRIRQNVVNASLSGDTAKFLRLPGGPIGFAVGGEYRKESSRFQPDALEVQGLTFSNKLLPSNGSFDVKEAFGELDLPLLRDVPFFKVLDLSAALRYADYSTTGHATTWKVDANWAPINDIRFRGTVSRAVRAPNISELFGAASQTYAFFDDPCLPSNLGLGKSTRTANCQAILSKAGLTPDQIANFEDTRTTNIAGVAGGNSKLTPEVANTWTAGIVLQPSFIRGLQISVDWYDIKLKQAINTVTAQQLSELCVDSPTIDNQFCANITRATGTGLITSFALQPQNVASFKTAGLDVNLTYRFELSKIGQFELRVVGNYLDKLSKVGVPGADPTDELGQYDYFSPKYQAYTTLSYASGPVTLNYNWSWFDKTRRYTLDKYKNTSYVAPEYAFVKARSVHNVYGALRVNEKFEFYGGVTNLFNQKPDLGFSTYPTEAIGTSFYAGFRAKF